MHCRACWQSWMSQPESDSDPKLRAPASQRLFFALWPSSELQNRIFHCGQLLASETPARLPPTENLHLTLLFLGQVSSEVQRCLEQAATALALPCFELDFGKLVHRHKQRMIWLQPDASPAALQVLVAGLRQIAADCGLSIDPRPYCAHMTLLSKVARAPTNLPRPAFVWPVREFVLVASKTLPAGAQYQIVKKWRLN